MSESQVTTINVFIEGDKAGFNSKNAIDKFKQAVKSSTSFNLNDLTKKYVKSGFNIEQVERTDNQIKFMIGKENQESNKKSNQPLQSNQTTTSEMSEREQKRQMLKTKLKLMRQDRTNSVYHQAKSNNSVPDDVLSEYMKLKKISKMPISS